MTKCERCNGTGKIRVSNSGHEKSGDDGLIAATIECFLFQEPHYGKTCPTCGGRGR